MPHDQLHYICKDPHVHTRSHLEVLRGCKSLRLTPRACTSAKQGRVSGRTACDPQTAGRMQEGQGEGQREVGLGDSPHLAALPRGPEGALSTKGEMSGCPLYPSLFLLNFLKSRILSFSLPEEEKTFNTSNQTRLQYGKWQFKS